MNKAKQMQKKLVKLAAIVGGILVFSLALMLFTGSLASDAMQRRSTAESARNSESSQISTIRSQIEKSGEAEKRFVEIALNHSSPDYSANTDALKDWLREMKEKYRLGDNFKLTLALDKPSDKPEFSNLNFTVTVREPMKLEFGAISDMHVFSFVRQLEQDMPGMLKITKFEMKRNSDLGANSFRELAAGATPQYVEAIIEFTWIGVEPKSADKQNAAPATAGGDV